MSVWFELKGPDCGRFSENVLAPSSEAERENFKPAHARADSVAEGFAHAQASQKQSLED